MASTKQEMKNVYPIPVYNYRVTIGGETHPFSEVSGLSISYESITYKHGLSWLEGVEQMPGMPEEVKLTLKRGMVKKRSLLLKWIQTIKLNQVEKRDITIDLCDESGKPVATWKVYNAFPVKMDVPSFTAEANEVAMESLDLVANYLETTYHDQ